jgi:hypothetical protein
MVINDVFHYILGLIIAIMALIQFGCARPERVITIYQDVYMPVACEIPHVLPPKKSENAALAVHDLVEYTRALKRTQRVCDVQ